MKQPERKSKIVIRQIHPGVDVFSDLSEEVIRDVAGVLVADRIEGSWISVCIDPRYDEEEVVAAIKALAEELPE